MIGNIKNQNQRNIIVEIASALDLAWKCDKATHIECLKQCHVIYGTEYIRVLSEIKLHYEDYIITVKYPAKLCCSESELLVGKTWQKYKDTSPKSTRMLRFLVHIFEEYCIEYSNLTDLVLILLSISPGTGPLERSYAKLTKISYKDRCNISTEVLEFLYLLATLDVKNDEYLFKTACKILQKEK